MCLAVSSAVALWAWFLQAPAGRGLVLGSAPRVPKAPLERLAAAVWDPFARRIRWGKAVAAPAFFGFLQGSRTCLWPSPLLLRGSTPLFPKGSKSNVRHPGRCRLAPFPTAVARRNRTLRSSIAPAPGPSRAAATGCCLPALKPCGDTSPFWAVYRAAGLACGHPSPAATRLRTSFYISLYRDLRSVFPSNQSGLSYILLDLRASSFDECTCYHMLWRVRIFIQLSRSSFGPMSSYFWSNPLWVKGVDMVHRSGH